jgi:hypothetical protein
VKLAVSTQTAMLDITASFLHTGLGFQSVMNLFKLRQRNVSVITNALSINFVGILSMNMLLVLQILNFSTLGTKTASNFIHKTNIRFLAGLLTLTNLKSGT